MRWFLIPLAAAAINVAAPLIITQPAAGQTASGTCVPGGSGTLHCPWGIDTPGSGTGRPTATGGSAGSGAASNVRWDAYGRVVTGPDGAACIRTQYRAVPVDTPPPKPPWDPNTAITSQAGVPILPCPPAEQSAYSGAEAVALRAWEDIRLPRPNPQIAPGRAITGKWAYLETRNQTQFEAQRSTLVGPLTIHATGTYSVDWGDGERSGPHSVEGKAWPDGEIRHDYINIGSYDVVVTERWTATWQIGAWSGTLRNLQTVGRIDDFPVEQIQAVIRA